MKLHKVKPKTTEEQYGPLREKGGKEKIYPTLRIHTDHVPEVKGSEVGSEHHIHIKGKLVGLSQSKFQNEAEFEIHHIGTESAEDREESGHESDEIDKKKGKEDDEDKEESGHESDKKDKEPPEDHVRE